MERMPLSWSAALAVALVAGLGGQRGEATTPDFIAFRYDPERVVIFVKETDQPPPNPSLPRTIPAGSRPLPAALAKYPGGHLVELDPPADVSDRAGDPWTIHAAPGVAVTATVERTVYSGADCTGVYGVIARVDEPWRERFRDVAFRYHVARRGFGEARVEESPLGSLAAPDAALRGRIEKLIRPEIARAVATVAAAVAPNYDRDTSRRGWAAGWKKTDAALMRGEGVVSFDAQAFRLTADGDPRLFVRADVRIAGKTAFLMSFWLRQSGESLSIEHADSQHSRHIRIGEFGGPLHDFPLSYQREILGIVDMNRDGRAEILTGIHFSEGHAIEAREYTGGEPQAAGAAFRWGC